MSQEYIDYVEDTIDKYSKISKLVNNNDISPQEINYALGSYLEVCLMLNAEYQRRKIEHLDLEQEYSIWYDEKFEEAKQSVLNEYKDTKIKPSLKEFEIRLRTMNSFEYISWQKKIQEAEAKMRFILRLMDDFSRFDRILTTLSHNMRSEMISLSVENRMNSDPTTVSNNKLRSQFPKRN